MSKIAFLDRDGVINQRAKEHEHIRDWNSFIFLDGVAEAIRILNEEGYQVVIVTNQSCIARGTSTKDQIEAIHARMVESLKADGAKISKVIYCPHDDGQCDCRKPGIGMFLIAENEFNIDKDQSYMIGDSVSDIEAGQKYGVHTILIGDAECDAEYCFNSLREAVQFLTGR